MDSPTATWRAAFRLGAPSLTGVARRTAASPTWRRLAPEQARAQFRLLPAEREHGQAPPLASARISASDDVASLTAWITSSNTSDEAIEHIGQAALVLADMHTQVTARRVLAEILRLHGKAQTLLRGGRQRLRQTRELIRIDRDLLAQRPASGLVEAPAGARRPTR